MYCVVVQNIDKVLSLVNNQFEEMPYTMKIYRYVHKRHELL